MPQNEYIEQSIKLHGRAFDHDEKVRKKAARTVHQSSKKAQKIHGFKAKLLNKRRHSEKIQIKKTIKMHQERNNKHKDDSKIQTGAVCFLLIFIGSYVLARSRKCV
jgi:ribosome biogenesis protein NSA2